MAETEIKRINGRTLADTTAREAAAKNAEEIAKLQQSGSGADGGYYTPAVSQPADDTIQFDWTPSKTGMPAVAPVQVTMPHSGGNANFQVDETLTLKEGVLSVNTTDSMEQDNTLPITSAGVYATVGNIEALLKTI